jgi:hypothetical protein
LTFSAGDANIYRFCADNPETNVDPQGLFIYLAKGITGRMDPVGVVHQDIAVDKWKKDKNDCWEKDGIDAFSFGITGKNVDYAAQKSWLGWSDLLVTGVLHLQLIAGKHREGVIYPSNSFDPNNVQNTLKTTVSEDRAWLAYMQNKRVKTTDR